MYQGKSIPIHMFNGGYCNNLPPDTLELNQAQTCADIVVLQGGKGFRSRDGTTAVGQLATGTTYPTFGLGYLNLSSGSEYLIAITGNNAGYKIKSSSTFGSSWSDITGAVTGLTAGADNDWDFITFNDVAIGFGGNWNSPDTPIKWTGSGNAALLTGSPPSAYGCFTANNRVFAFRTAAAMSTIYWSVLANAEDWTGAGSGSATVGNLNDNQKVTGAALLDANNVIIFKENSMYRMVLTAAPFPVYSFSDTVGCLNKNAVVEVEGTVYFITSQYQMKSTDGNTITSYSRNADDLWYAFQTSQTDTRQIRGFRQKGQDYDWIVWTQSSFAGQASSCIVWDLANQCWLRNTDGYQGLLSVVSDKLNRYYAATINVTTTNNFIRVGDPASFSDINGITGGTQSITASWRSGMMNPSSIEDQVRIDQMAIQFATKSSDSISVTYDFDYASSLSKSFSISMAPVGSEAYTMRTARLTGRGNVFQFQMSIPSSTVRPQISAITLRGKVFGQKSKAT